MLNLRGSFWEDGIWVGGKKVEDVLRVDNVGEEERERRKEREEEKSEGAACGE